MAGVVDQRFVTVEVDLDGLEFLRAERSGGTEVPSVLLLTSVDLPELFRESRSLVVQACLVKPVRRLDLINAMRSSQVARPVIAVRPAHAAERRPGSKATGRSSCWSRTTR